jgi:hypothetical protein
MTGKKHQSRDAAPSAKKGGFGGSLGTGPLSTTVDSGGSRGPTIHIYIWVNYNDLTATSLGNMVSIENDPQMALIQLSEIL